MSIVGRVRWSQRNKLAKLARKAREPNVIRRALAIGQLARGQKVSQVAEALCAARWTVYSWAGWFREGGIDALCEERRGSAPRTVSEDLVSELESLLDTTPQSLGYLRSRWSSELLAKVLHERTGVCIHASTVRRLLGPAIGFGAVRDLRCTLPTRAKPSACAPSIGRSPIRSLG